MRKKLQKISRQVITYAIIVMLVLSTIPIVSAATNNKFKYDILSDGTIEITSYIGNESEVIIPESIDEKKVTKLNEFTFYSSDNYNGLNYTVKTITIPEGIKNLGDNELEWRLLNRIINLSSINISKDNESYSSIDGILFNKNLSKLIYYPSAKIGTEYIVPSFVKELGHTSFPPYLSFLKVLKIPHPLEKVDDAAIMAKSIEEANYPVYNVPIEEISIFNFCENLKKVKIGKDVRWINEGDFSGSNNVKLFVYSNSYGLEWAKSHNFPYVIMDDTKVSETSNIEVSGINSDATLEVASISPDTEIKNAEIAYNISVSNLSSEIETVKVSIPASKRMLVCKKTTSGIEEIKSSFSDGQVSFETSDPSGEYIMYSPEWGDTNFDESVTITDVTESQKIIANIITADIKKQQIADYDGDGQVTIKDTTTVQRKLAQLL